MSKAIQAISRTFSRLFLDSSNSNRDIMNSNRRNGNNSEAQDNSNSKSQKKDNGNSGGRINHDNRNIDVHNSHNNNSDIRINSDHELNNHSADFADDSLSSSSSSGSMICNASDSTPQMPLSSSGRRSEKRKMLACDPGTSSEIAGPRRTSNSAMDLGLGVSMMRDDYVMTAPDAIRVGRHDHVYADTDIIRTKRRRPTDHDVTGKGTSMISLVGTEGPTSESDDAVRAHPLVFYVGPGTVDEETGDGEEVTNSGMARGLNRTASSAEWRIPCDMDDVWTEAYYELPHNRHTQVKTADDYTDSIMQTVVFRGYMPKLLLSHGNSTVLLARATSGRQQHLYVALKFIAEDAARFTHRFAVNRDVPDEARIMTDLHHPNIVELLDFWPVQGRRCLVLEFCQNGNIQALLEKRPAGFFLESTCRRYLKDMLSAIAYLHEQGVVHRAVNTNNFLVDCHDHVKLADFRFAIAFKAGDNLRRDRPGGGTCHPQEYYKAEAYNPRAVDVWDLGCVLFKMLTGRNITYRDIDKINDRSFSDDDPLILSQDVKTLVSGMCSIDPDDRYSLSRIRCSDWLTNTDDSVAIGNYHLARQPQKIQDGKKWAEYKLGAGI